MSQERNIVITNKAIYNLKKKSNFFPNLALKRRIDISLIRGLSISKITDEFVIHGNDVEYDYDYVSARRKKTTTRLEGQDVRHQPGNNEGCLDDCCVARR